MKGKTYWLVGASEGLGLALAKQMSAQGVKTIISSRDQAELDAIAKDLEGATPVALDVTDEKSLETAAAKIGAVDGVVYIAGAYNPMTAQQWDTPKVLKMIDVNFLGAVRVLGHALPDMVQRNTGHVVLIGSLAGYQGLPGAIGYGASKSGLMHLGQNLLCDLQHTDIKVQVINPGYIKTRLTDKNDFTMPQIMEPEKAAEHVMKAMHSKRFMKAFPAPFSWLFVAGRLIPYKLYAKIFG